MTLRIYTIRNQDGNYISPKQTKNGWYFLIYSGRTTGFTFYNEQSKFIALNELNELNKFGNNFFLDSVDNIKIIPKGKLLIDEEESDNNTYRFSHR